MLLILFCLLKSSETLMNSSKIFIKCSYPPFSLSVHILFTWRRFCKTSVRDAWDDFVGPVAGQELKLIRLHSQACLEHSATHSPTPAHSLTPTHELTCCSYLMVDYFIIKFVPISIRFVRVCLLSITKQTQPTKRQ